LTHFLTHWALPAHTYTAPEIAAFVAVGVRLGQTIRTSMIVEVLGERTFRTVSGSVYQLEGPPGPGNAADPDRPLEWCRKCLGVQGRAT